MRVAAKKPPTDPGNLQAHPGCPSSFPRHQTARPVPRTSRLTACVFFPETGMGAGRGVRYPGPAPPAVKHESVKRVTAFVPARRSRHHPLLRRRDPTALPGHRGPSGPFYLRHSYPRRAFRTRGGRPAAKSRRPTHRVTSPAARRVTRLVVAADWQVTLVLTGQTFKLGPPTASEEAGRVRMRRRPRRPKFPRAPRRARPAISGARNQKRLLTHRITWSSPSSAPSLARPSRQGLHVVIPTLSPLSPLSFSPSADLRGTPSTVVSARSVGVATAELPASPALNEPLPVRTPRAGLGHRLRRPHPLHLPRPRASQRGVGLGRPDSCRTGMRLKCSP